jgi:hypothetical protein
MMMTPFDLFVMGICTAVGVIVVFWFAVIVIQAVKSRQEASRFDHLTIPPPPEIDVSLSAAAAA